MRCPPFPPLSPPSPSVHLYQVGNTFILPGDSLIHFEDFWVNFKLFSVFYPNPTSGKTYCHVKVWWTLNNCKIYFFFQFCLNRISETSSQYHSRARAQRHHRWKSRVKIKRSTLVFNLKGLTSFRSNKD